MLPATIHITHTSTVKKKNKSENLKIINNKNLVQYKYFCTHMEEKLKLNIIMLINVEVTNASIFTAFEG